MQMIHYTGSSIKHPDRTEKASTMVAVLFIVSVASIVVATMMNRSQTSARLVNYSDVNAELRSAAEGELERIFYVWKQMKSGQTLDPSLLNPVPSSMPTSWTDATIKTYLEMPPAASTIGYNVATDIALGSRCVAIAPTSYRYQMIIDPAKINKNGLLTGSGVGNTIPGKISTYEFRVWARKATLGGTKIVGLSRSFTLLNAPAFSNAIFYNGVLEMTAGGVVTINGAITSNDDIYLGSVKNGLGTNKLDIQSSVTPFGRLNDDEGCQTDIEFRKDGLFNANYDSPTFINRSQQAGRLSEAQNFLGGLDAVAIQEASPTIFPTLNDVYRSVISRPPTSGADNASVSPTRMYNKAGIRIEVKASQVLATDTLSGVVYDITSSGIIPTGNLRKNVWDKREGENVAMTTIDVAAFTAVLNTVPSVRDNFNGILYVYDSASTKAGIRLLNGQSAPNFTSTGVDDPGFTVASDTGVYIEGDYNTIPGSNGKISSCVVMGDAVTALSNNWDDANAASLKGARVASNTTYNCAVLTGDVPTDTALSSLSGGAHNLVRLLEDWTGKTYTLFGSIGQLFSSKIFDAPWQNQLDVYSLPTYRNIGFDTALSENPPSSFVNLTKASRGNYMEIPNGDLN